MALENVYKITVNTKKKMFRELPEVIQNDNVVFEVDIIDDTTTFTLSAGYSYKLVSLKQSGLSTIRDGVLSGQVIRFNLGTSEMTEPGKVEATVQVFDSYMKRISTAKFDYVVKKDPSLQGSLPADNTSLVIANESLLTDAISKSNKASTDSSTALTKATTAETKSTNAETTANTVKSQFDQVVAEAGSNNPEVVQARGTEVNLNARLTKNESLLVEKAKQTDLVVTNGNVSLKADKTYVDQQIGNIGNASPKGTYANLSALQTAFPTGTTGLYLTLDNGHWYYWNGSAWTDGGVYQATGVSTANQNEINNVADISDFLIGDRTSSKLKKIQISNSDWTLDSATVTTSGSNIQINATTGYYTAIYKNITKLKFKISATVTNTPFILLGIGSTSYTAIGVHTNVQRNILEIPRAGAAYSYTNLLAEDKTLTAAAAGDEVLVELSGTWVIVSIKKVGQT